MVTHSGADSALGCGCLDRVRAGATLAVRGLPPAARHPAQSREDRVPMCRRGAGRGHHHSLCSLPWSGCQVLHLAASPARPHQSLHSELTSQPGPRARRVLLPAWGHPLATVLLVVRPGWVPSTPRAWAAPSTGPSMPWVLSSCQLRAPSFLTWVLPRGPCPEA